MNTLIKVNIVGSVRLVLWSPGEVGRTILLLVLRCRYKSTSRILTPRVGRTKQGSVMATIQRQNASTIDVFLRFLLTPLVRSYIHLDITHGVSGRELLNQEIINSVDGFYLLLTSVADYSNKSTAGNMTAVEGPTLPSWLYMMSVQNGS